MTDATDFIEGIAADLYANHHPDCKTWRELNRKHPDIAEMYRRNVKLVLCRWQLFLKGEGQSRH